MSKNLEKELAVASVCSSLLTASVPVATAQKKRSAKALISKSPAKSACALLRNSHWGDASSLFFCEKGYDLI